MSASQPHEMRSPTANSLLPEWNLPIYVGILYVSLLREIVSISFNWFSRVYLSSGKVPLIWFFPEFSRIFTYCQANIPKQCKCLMSSKSQMRWVGPIMSKTCSQCYRQSSSGMIWISIINMIESGFIYMLNKL